MRAAKMKERPTFQLMCQTDVQSIYHMTGTPHSFRKSHIISIDALSENSGLYEEALAA